MRAYDPDRLYANEAQVQRLGRMAQLLQKINGAADQVLKNVVRFGGGHLRYAGGLSRLENFATAMNCIVSAREELLHTCRQQGPDTIVLQFGCADHPLESDAPQMPHGPKDTLVPSAEWRDKVQVLLLLIDSMIDQCVTARSMHSSYLRVLLKLSKALRRQHRHLEQMEPRKGINIKVEEEQCPVCAQECQLMNPDTEI